MEKGVRRELVGRETMYFFLLSELCMIIIIVCDIDYDVIEKNTEYHDYRSILLDVTRHM